MNKILHLTIFLAIISAVAGGALAFANQMTAPVIAANNLKTEQESLQKMYTEAALDDFKQVDYTGDSKTIQKVYSYKDVYIFNMSVSGYKDGTTFLVSINKDTGVVDKYLGLSNGDTKGLGSKVLDDETFIKGIEGKKASDHLDTISGATISSSAVTSGINEAADAMDDLKGE